MLTEFFVLRVVPNSMNRLPEKKLHCATSSNSRITGRCVPRSYASTYSSIARSASELGSSFLFGTVFLSAAVLGFGIYGAIAICTMPETGFAETFDKGSMEKTNLKIESDYKFGFTQAAYSMQRDSEERAKQRSRAYAARKLFPDAGMTLRGYNAFASTEQNNETTADRKTTTDYRSATVHTPPLREGRQPTRSVEDKAQASSASGATDRLARVAARAKYSFNGLERSDSGDSLSDKIYRTIGIDPDGIDTLRGEVKGLPTAVGRPGSSRGNATMKWLAGSGLAQAPGNSNSGNKNQAGSAASYKERTGLDHPPETAIEFAAVMAHEFVLVATDALGLAYHSFIEPATAYADQEHDLDSILSPRNSVQHSFERDELTRF